MGGERAIPRLDNESPWKIGDVESLEFKGYHSNTVISFVRVDILIKHYGPWFMVNIFPSVEQGIQYVSHKEGVSADHWYDS